MICQVMPIEDFVEEWGDYVHGHLLRYGSEFDAKLRLWLDGDVPTDEDGHIAVIIDQGEVVAWARTEKWLDSERVEWDTLLFFYGIMLCVAGLGGFGYLAIGSDIMMCLDHLEPSTDLAEGAREDRPGDHGRQGQGQCGHR